MTSDPDADLAEFDAETLRAELRRLRAAIRAHRDASGHDLCWYHPELWSLLPEAAERVPIVPDWPDFLRGCIAYRSSLDVQLPEAPRSPARFSGETDRA